MKYRLLAVVFSLALAGVACSGDDTEGNDPVVTIDSGTDARADAQADADASSDGGGSDGGGSPDVSYDASHWEPRCGDAPIRDWPLHDELADGDVTSTGDAEARTLVIDANAGGFGEASNNPFVYVNLGTGEKVDVTDIEAFESVEWDLAFRRTAIRTNSADSGPGGVSLAQLQDTSFAEVDQAPQDESDYEQDVSYDENCEAITDPIGALYTAFNYVNVGSRTGSWYDYSEGGSVDSPEGIIYVVDVPARAASYKLDIDTWEDGVYTIHVGEL